MTTSEQQMSLQGFAKSSHNMATGEFMWPNICQPYWSLGTSSVCWCSALFTFHTCNFVKQKIFSILNKYWLIYKSAFIPVLIQRGK